MLTSSAILASTGIGAVGKIANSAMKFAFDMAKMNKQYDLKMQYDRDKWENNMQGMKEAGINPAAFFGGSGGWVAGDARRNPGTTHSMAEATNGGFVTARALPTYIKPAAPKRREIYHVGQARYGH